MRKAERARYEANGTNRAMRQCPSCLAFYAPLGTWQTICRRCYGESRKRENERLRIDNDRLRSELADAKVSPFEPEFVRQLIQLTHPDKHGGSDLAQAVTKRLLEMKRRIDGA